MNLLNLLPWYYRWAAVSLLSLAVAASAWLSGVHHAQREFDTYVAQVRATGEAQAAKTAGIVANQTTITATIGDSYGSASARLPRRPGRRSLHDNPAAPGSGSRPLPAVPGAAPGVDGPSADNRPHPADPPPDLSTCQAEYARLREDAAQTTLQALYWRAWARREREANPK